MFFKLLSIWTSWWEKQLQHKRRWLIGGLLGSSAAMILGLWPAVLEYQARSLIPQASLTQSSQPEATSYQFTSTPTASPTPTVVLLPDLTVEQVFRASQANDRTLVEQLPQTEVIRVDLAGDVMLGRMVGFNMARYRDFAWPVRQIGLQVRQADLTLVNLENPVVEGCPIMTEGMRFCSPIGSLKSLEFMGVDAVNLANNHTLNFGLDGLEQTVEFLSAAQIDSFGIRDKQPLIMQVRGQRIALLGYSDVGNQPGSILAYPEKDRIKNDLAQARAQADLVLVSFHWGQEYQPMPDVYQRKLAYWTIDQGADVVWGHHPHWLQGMEFYRQKPIFYSLGNLVFDQMWSKPTREGMVVELDFYKNRLAGVYLKPTFMQQYARPEWQVLGNNNSILKRLEKWSSTLQQSQEKLLAS